MQSINHFNKNYCEYFARYDDIEQKVCIYKLGCNRSLIPNESLSIESSNTQTFTAAFPSAVNMMNKLLIQGSNSKRLGTQKWMFQNQRTLETTLP